MGQKGSSEVIHDPGVTARIIVIGNEVSTSVTKKVADIADLCQKLTNSGALVGADGEKYKKDFLEIASAHNTMSESLKNKIDKIDGILELELKMSSGSTDLVGEDAKMYKQAMTILSERKAGKAGAAKAKE